MSPAGRLWSGPLFIPKSSVTGWRINSGLLAQVETVMIDCKTSTVPGAIDGQTSSGFGVPGQDAASKKFKHGPIAAAENVLFVVGNHQPGWFFVRSKRLGPAESAAGMKC